MKYDELINAGKIHKQKFSRRQIEQALKRSERDLKTAKKLLGQDDDWAFAIAYDAVLQASRAYMAAKGFRPAAAQGHKNTFAFMDLAMGEDYRDLIAYFDRMRNKRNQTIYDLSGTITGTEAAQLLEKAARFVTMIRSLV
jgi:uncharacterized protein (UPF0332 family)